MADSFHILRPSWMRASSRRVCSSSLTSSQYLSRMIPGFDDRLLHERHSLKKTLHLRPPEQKPITRSTPARLYQLRSKITTSPAAGKCGI